MPDAEETPPQEAMTLRMPKWLWDRMEAARGAIPRERWVRWLVERETDPELQTKPTEGP